MVNLRKRCDADTLRKPPREGNAVRKRVLINVPCYFACGRIVKVDPERYSRGLVCGECWDEQEVER